MIERQFIQQKTKEYYIKKEIEKKLRGAGLSQIRLQKIPLGEKIIIHTSKPSIIVGSKGSNIKDLTKKLKKDFQLENPQLEIVEVKDIFLDAKIVAERIASSLERFGSARFKGIAHKIMENVLNSGALGMELIISGKIPGARAKSWRFYQGYLKKCGDIAITGVRRAQKSALLKSGIIGIKVAIMPPDLSLPDQIEIVDQKIETVEESTKESAGEAVKKEAADSAATSRKGKKRTSRKKPAEGKSSELTSPREESTSGAETLVDRKDTDESAVSNSSNVSNIESTSDESLEPESVKPESSNIEETASKDRALREETGGNSEEE